MLHGVCRYIRRCAVTAAQHVLSKEEDRKREGS